MAKKKMAVTVGSGAAASAVAVGVLSPVNMSMLLTVLATAGFVYGAYSLSRMKLADIVLAAIVLAGALTVPGLISGLPVIGGLIGDAVSGVMSVLGGVAGGGLLRTAYERFLGDKVLG